MPLDPSDLDVLQFLTAPNVSSEEHLCSKQKARSGQAQNFSVLAINIILVVVIFIILIDINLIDSLATCSGKRIRPTIGA